MKRTNYFWTKRGRQKSEVLNAVLLILSSPLFLFIESVNSQYCCTAARRPGKLVPRPTQVVRTVTQTKFFDLMGSSYRLSVLSAWSYGASLARASRAPKLRYYPSIYQYPEVGYLLNIYTVNWFKYCLNLEIFLITYFLMILLIVF